ncbi:hypothetical protein ACFPA8_25775 [Streptomyces ovatisporus]|uniref:Uncharacterized protein n=1 Tax=Streptomyces ovatisporus TaxID=1128682 RepID=A0ABV9ACB9_9ACTN
MQNLTQNLTQDLPLSRPHDRLRSTSAEPESMDELRSDCARMAPHWTGPISPSATPSWGASHPARRVGQASSAGRNGTAGSYGTPQGVRVPASSARLLDGMSEYGLW